MQARIGLRYNEVIPNQPTNLRLFLYDEPEKAYPIDILDSNIISRIIEVVQDMNKEAEQFREIKRIICRQ